MKIKQGMQVVVNECPDAIIYTAAAFDGFLVRLEYTNDAGQVVSGGVLDCSLLKRPTAAQIRNSKRPPLVPGKSFIPGEIYQADVPTDPESAIEIQVIERTAETIIADLTYIDKKRSIRIYKGRGVSIPSLRWSGRRMAIERRDDGVEYVLPVGASTLAPAVTAEFPSGCPVITPVADQAAANQ